MGHDDTGAIKSLDVRPSHWSGLLWGVKHVPHSKNRSKQSYWVTYPAKIDQLLYQLISHWSPSSKNEALKNFKRFMWGDVAAALQTTRPH